MFGEDYRGYSPILDYGPNYRFISRRGIERLVWSPHPESYIKPTTDASPDLLRIRLELDTAFKFPSRPPLKYITVNGSSAGSAAMSAAHPPR